MLEPKHRYLIANPTDELRAREHAADLNDKAALAGIDCLYEVVLKDSCPPGQMFLLHYLPSTTWFTDTTFDRKRVR